MYIYMRRYVDMLCVDMRRHAKTCRHTYRNIYIYVYAYIYIYVDEDINRYR